ncbi:hypothetical protein A1O1_09037 [Capronia coronata CBS 617.96]|uniref:Uncharacterized protein n=1 Tax=Capronia coronata CBS 617.96 TaxID=1182541 RepID=W9XNU2_9EURO|nr:uncharacterized protein A1O1_09037 [Capronia coronata CBS 617.96]EXJ78636.1 hypothetical protein A1O1_09037 [Capronia coronata CBS 617.96]
MFCQVPYNAGKIQHGDLIKVLFRNDRLGMCGALKMTLNSRSESRTLTTKHVRAPSKQPDVERHPLILVSASSTFEPLALGAVKPLGWLRQQMDLMANGLPGHLHEFYRLVKDAPWLGGDEEYSELNEAWPYSYNALVPLAWITDDARLKHHVLQVTKWIIDHQHDDGWLGPEVDLARRNFWARYPLFLGFMQLVEAEPELGQTVILPAMHRFVKLMHEMLADHHQGYVWKPGDEFDEQWGRSRAADMVLALQWLYEKHPMDNGRIIQHCMVHMYEMAYDWSYWFHEDHFLKEDLDLVPVNVTQKLFPYIHGVNAGQGLKWPAVMRRLTHDDSLLNTTRNGVNWTFQYHGTPSGAVIGDEREAGLSPVRGTELCSVVESIFSLNYLYQAVGDRDFADKSELAAYNALPVMFMPRWWAHQYLAQTNQPISHRLDRSPFWNVGALGQTFGTEPHFPCCTVNMQGYSKFVPAMFVKVGDDGLAHALLGPSQVDTTLTRRNRVRIRCETNYPFSNHLDYEIKAGSSFRFSFRVPSWAVLEQSGLWVDSGKEHPLQPDHVTGLHTMIITAGRTRVEVVFGARVRIEPRANDTISIYHGALLYALPVAGDYRPSRPARYPGTSAPPEANDWEIFPREPWNVAIDSSTLKFYEYPNRYAASLPDPIWNEEAPPVSISALACKIDWHLEDGYAPEPPLMGRRNCTGRAFPVELRPYGSAKLHMAELPTVDLRPGSPDLWRPGRRDIPGLDASGLVLQEP